MAQTKVLDLINPQVMADEISGKLPNAIRFAPYAKIDTTLVGIPGDTITRPKYGYVGAAADLTEGVPMDPAKMTMTTAPVTIKEAGKAIEVTEKAILTNVSGTIEEAERQLLLAMADKVEIDYLATLNTTLQAFNGAPTSLASIIDAKDVFNDEEDEKYVLFINPKDYTALVKSLFNVGGDIAQTAIAKAKVAELAGVDDIVRTRRTAQGTAFIQKREAVEIVLKRDVNVKAQEDILARTVVLASNSYYTTNLFNDAGVVKIKVTQG